MAKKLMYAALCAGLILMLISIAGDVGAALLSGDADLLSWIYEHKYILLVVACFFGLRALKIGPFNEEK